MACPWKNPQDWRKFSLTSNSPNSKIHILRYSLQTNCIKNWATRRLRFFKTQSRDRFRWKKYLFRKLSKTRTQNYGQNITFHFADFVFCNQFFMLNYTARGQWPILFYEISDFYFTSWINKLFDTSLLILLKPSLSDGFDLTYLV